MKSKQQQTISTWITRLPCVMILVGICCAPLETIQAEASRLIVATALSQDGKMLASAEDGVIQIRPKSEQSVVATLNTQMRRVHDLAFSPDGSRLLVAGGVPGESGDLEIWDWQSTQCTTRAAVHGDLIYGAAWSPDAKRIATASWDNACHIIASHDLQVERTFTGHSRPVLAVCFVGTSNLVVSAGVDHTVQMWESDSGQLVRKFDNHVGTVYDVAMRPSAGNGDLAWMATASEDRTVRFWQPTLGRMVRFTKLESAPLCLAWNEDGSRVMAGCQDGTVREIDPVTLDVKVHESRTAVPIYTLP